MFRWLTVLPLCAIASAQEAPSSLENMQKLIESAKPLASALLRVPIRGDLRTTPRPAGSACGFGPAGGRQGADSRKGRVEAPFRGCGDASVGGYQFSVG